MNKNNSRKFENKKIHLWAQKKKKLIGKAMVESVACYGYEVCLFKTEEQRKVLALEME